MIREKNQIKLTDVDEQRFTFHKTKDDRTAGIIRNLRNTCMSTTCLLLILLIVIIVFLFRPLENGWVWLLIGLGLLDVFVIFANYSLYRTNVQRFETLTHYIEIEILEKLPVETEVLKTERGKNETFYFYPVKARDTNRKNYRSVCYLTREEYESIKVGDVTQLYIPREEKKKMPKTGK